MSVLVKAFNVMIGPAAKFYVHTNPSTFLSIAHRDTIDRFIFTSCRTQFGIVGCFVPMPSSQGTG